MRLSGLLAGLLLLFPALAGAQPPLAPAAQPRPRPPSAKPAELAAQLTSLAFDANPAWRLPERKMLGRWSGPLRLFVFGRPSDSTDAAQAARTMTRITRLPVEVVATNQVVQAPPNSFLVVDENIAGAFRGPLRQMLRNAFLDDEAAVDDFIATVIAVQPCWTLPIWTDSSRLILKAAVMGIDARQPAPAVRRCITTMLAASLGLLGSDATLADLLLNPQSHAARLSRDDERMLRLLYTPALRVGMTRSQTLDAALAALGAPPHSAAPRPGPTLMPAPITPRP